MIPLLVLFNWDGVSYKAQFANRRMGKILLSYFFSCVEKAATGNNSIVELVITIFTLVVFKRLPKVFQYIVCIKYKSKGNWRVYTLAKVCRIF